VTKAKSGNVKLASIPMRDRLYIQFIMGMSAYHYGKYMTIPQSRKDYLFSLWVKKHHGDIK
jgi:hypothetical protein